ncbi:hypothetical protein J6590_073287 [Homalodisca vitripennis]|nr:hypothetical protein J6590_073287 [Homalodisca vitripennis]
MTFGRVQNLHNYSLEEDQPLRKSVFDKGSGCYISVNPRYDKSPCLENSLLILCASTPGKLEAVKISGRSTRAALKGNPIAGLQADLLLPNLQARRCVADVLFLTKLVNGQLDCPMLLSQVDFRIPLARTRSRDLFSRRHCQRSYVFHGPLARMVRLGNGFCDTFDIFNDSAAIIRRRVLAAAAKCFRLKSDTVTGLTPGIKSPRLSEEAKEKLTTKTLRKLQGK